MGESKIQNWQIVNEAALKSLGKTVRSTNEVIMGGIEKEIEAPLRLQATFPTPDSKLNFSASFTDLADGGKRSLPPLSNQIFTIAASTIDFQTQATTGATFDVTWPASTLNYYRLAGFTLLASGNIQVLFSDEASSLGAIVANAGSLLIEDGLPLGYIALKCTNVLGYFKTANSSTNIIENADIKRFGAGGGAGGGSGNASEITERIKNTLDTSVYQYATPNVFATDKVSKINAGNTTAIYDVVSKTYKFVNIADKVESLQHLDADFLASGYDIQSCNLEVFWDIASYDPAAIYKVSRDGGNEWQTVTMPRFGVTDLWKADYTFVDEATHGFNTTLTYSALTLNASNYFSTSYAVANSMTVKHLDIDFTKTGSPAGNLKFQIVKDSTGAPDLTSSGLLYDSNWMAISGISTGTLQVSLTTPIAAQTVWVLVLTDDAYKASYSAGVTQMAVQANAVDIRGRVLDLRVQITSSATNKYLKGYGIYYGNNSMQIVSQSNTAVSIPDYLKSYFNDYVVGIDTDVEDNKTYVVPNTTIIGRKKIVNPMTSLEVVGPVKRIMTQQIYRIADESGPNGEPVWGVVGDKADLIRFIGAGWVSVATSSGPMTYSSSVNDYCEILVVGSGLNAVAQFASDARDARVTIDGGSESATNILIGSSASSILNARGYSTNQGVNIASGLSTTVPHIVKIRCNGVVLPIYGFEILNEATTLKGLPGSYFSNKQLVTTTTIDSLPFKPTALTTTKGACVINYKDAYGAYGQVFTEVAATPTYMNSADHTNEKMVREYSWREFGCGQSFDFSIIPLDAVQTPKSFVLDDNLTALACDAAYIYPTMSQGITWNGSSNFIAFSFFGVGLDVLLTNVATQRQFHVYIDGIQRATNFDAGKLSQTWIQKICSGLSCGLHTVKFAYAGGTGGNMPPIISFRTYLPKDPTLPLNAVQSSMYYVPADYDGSTITGTAIADNMQVPVGCIFKPISREFTFVGAGWTIGSAVNVLGGWQTYNASTSQPFSYTFSGTGFVLVLCSWITNTYDFSVTVDGSLNASGVVRSNASNLGAGSYRSTATTYDQPVRIEFTGLSQGKHTISVQKTAGSGSLSVSGIHVIVPAYSPTSQLPYDFQNTLTVGNTSLTDLRKASPITFNAVNGKAVYKAEGSTNVTTSSTAFVPLASMSLSVCSKGGMYELNSMVAFYLTSAGGAVYSQFVVNGVPVGISTITQSTINIQLSFSNTCPVYLAKGYNKIDVYWAVNSGSNTALSTARILTAKEL